MNSTGVGSIDAAVQKIQVCMNELMQATGWTDRHQAYYALRTVLHAVRDRLGVDGAAAFAGHLSILLQGLFFEGWHPTETPARRGKDGFMGTVAAEYRGRPDGDPEEIVRAVFRVLARHITRGEADEVAHLLPADVRALWPS